MHFTCFLSSNFVVCFLFSCISTRYCMCVVFFFRSSLFLSSFFDLFRTHLIQFTQFNMKKKYSKIKTINLCPKWKFTLLFRLYSQFENSLCVPNTRKKNILYQTKYNKKFTFLLWMFHTQKNTILNNKIFIFDEKRRDGTDSSYILFGAHVRHQSDRWTRVTRFEL